MSSRAAAGGGPAGDGGRKTAAAAAKSAPGFFRRIVELFFLLCATLAAVFFYKSAEEATGERDRLERELRRIKEEKRKDHDGDSPSSGLCAICLTSPVESVFQPCGHACSCSPCGRRLERCPICREVIRNVTKIFLAT